ncbi:aldehyde dehydrogenase family protein [Sulfitobacter sp.]|uniref:aldehyde dehydrogenase family protein n=1 Tax=Sulfitobacter sp. TaxID=1903071 RepID=UPI0030011A38
MSTAKKLSDVAEQPELARDVAALKANAAAWAQSSIEKRIGIISQMRDRLNRVAPEWAAEAATKKQIPQGSPLAGEEWISGPYAVMAAMNHLIETLSEMKDKKFLKKIPLRETVTGQVSAKIVPHSIWDYLLLSGVRADVWMEKGVTAANLATHTASAYDIAPKDRKGVVSLVLGAGNIAAITPLDCFQKIFSEHSVVVLKMNPVNDYLAPYLADFMKPLIDVGALRIVTGGTDVGQYLCNHPDIEEIHITGAETSHDAIVWGVGAEGVANKAAGTPQNPRKITSELGAVCPVIIVPGPWTAADLKFQAAQVATMKLHNSGFNCVACQVMVMPGDWDKAAKFKKTVTDVMANAPTRGLYYPGAKDRLQAFEDNSSNVVKLERVDAEPILLEPETSAEYFKNTEVFAPAMTTHEIAGTDPAQYLRDAVEYCNTELHGTLGANILIHPATIKQIGKKQFEEILADLRYGTIAINAWTGLGFLMPQCPWGAFPGHTLDDVQSGIGFVHNTYMFDKVERCIVWAPFRPFPRNLLSLSMTLLPKPPWLVTNRKQHIIGMLLTRFQYKPSFLKIPRIFLNALLG